jgi:branched-chain amino acid transport system permease protein
VDQFLQHVMNAVMLGSTYALLGIGLTLIFGIMRIVNFTHGEFYALGAYMAYLFVVQLGINFFAAILLATAVGIVVGAALEFFILRRLKTTDIDSVMLLMIGLWIAMQNTEQLIWGGVAKLIPSPFSQQPMVFGPVSVSPLKVFVLITAVFLLIGFHFLINHTRLGLAMRSTFQDRDVAALMGVNVGTIYLATFALGSGLAAVAGALLGPIFLVNPTMGDLASLKAFAIVILGGLGSTVGATIGGFALALVEEFGAGYLSADFRDAYSFLVIVAVLILRPQGLFVMKERVG